MDTVVQPIPQPRNKRRYRSAEERRRIVEETLVPCTSVAMVARGHGVNANQVFAWRKLYHAGRLGSTNATSVEVLRRYVMPADKLHGDDTPVPGRLWTYVRDDRAGGDAAPPAVWFASSPDRKGEHPQQHVSQFRGILQADAYAGFNQLYENGSIQQAPCLHTSGGSSTT
jgi:hypothetical protein